MTDRRAPIVAFVTDAIYPYHNGGKEMRYYELIRRLARRAEVHVYTMRWWAGPRTLVKEGISYHAICPRLDLYAGGRRSLSEALLFGLACLRLIGYGFDVIEADQIPFSQIFILRLIATIRRKPLVITWHEVWDESYWRQYFPLFGWAAWLISRLAMHLPDHIIAASPQTAERLEATLGEHPSITVAPNGIDFDVIRGVQPASDVTDIVFVGRLIAHKRIDMLLDAVAALHADGMSLTCRIIGNGPERDQLHAQVRALRLEGAVDFRHDVRGEKDIYALLKAARIFVFPSCREGFGIAVLEAIACGLPVVTTTAPDNLSRFLVARSAHGVVCEPSALSIAAAVKSVLTDPGWTPSGDPDGQDSWIMSYSWDAIADQVAKGLLPASSVPLTRPPSTTDGPQRRLQVRNLFSRPAGPRAHPGAAAHRWQHD
jgi:glycosyltransferase involved in cell wall biosynthesis